MIEALLSINRWVWLTSGDRVSVVLMKRVARFEKSGWLSVSMEFSPPIALDVTNHGRRKGQMSMEPGTTFQRVRRYSSKSVPLAPNTVVGVRCESCLLIVEWHQIWYHRRMDAAVLLQEARRRSGLSRRKLAHLGGTSASTLSAYELGATVP